MKNKCSICELARECSVDKDKLYKAYLLVREYAIEVFPLSSAQVVATNYAQSFGFEQEKIRNLQRIVEEVGEFKKHKEKDEVVAVIGLLLAHGLGQIKRDIMDFVNISGVKIERIKKLYREVFAVRFKVLKNFGTHWNWPTSLICREAN